MFGYKLTAILYFLLNDIGALLLIQATLVAVAIFARSRSRKSRRAEGGFKATVVRGEKSWNDFALFYGFASVLLLQVINAAHGIDGYKVFLSVLDLWILMYLCFFNPWSRNKITVWLSKSRGMREA